VYEILFKTGIKSMFASRSTFILCIFTLKKRVSFI
jgi:hypothetical protein